MPAQKPGTLYLVPTPISESADDIPPRTVRAYQTLSYFIVENEKTARRHFKLVVPERKVQEIIMARYDEHSKDSGINELLRPLLDGQDGGLMSEAGCPCVADPGSAVVAAARQLGIPVVPLVGPSSLLLALMASGMPGQQFTFNGYLPREDKDLAALVRQISEEKSTSSHLFIETPYRTDSARKRLAAWGKDIRFVEGTNLGAAASEMAMPEQDSAQQKEATELSVFVVSSRRSK